VLLPDESKPVNDEEHESFMKDPTARSTGNKP
jgi:hypothetical protein